MRPSTDIVWGVRVISEVPFAEMRKSITKLSGCDDGFGESEFVGSQCVDLWTANASAEVVSSGQNRCACW